MGRPLIGEPLPLDLVNTAGSFGDALTDTADLQAWLAERGLAVRADGPLLAALLDTRAALRGVLEHPGDAEARAALNAVLDHGRVRVTLTAAGPVERVDCDDPAWVLPFTAARELLELLAARADRIKACGGDGCVLWFLDTTRSGTRRWCSMAGCGNRTKVHRHRARSRAAPD